jgi:hypothetical protein
VKAARHSVPAPPPPPDEVIVTMTLDDAQLLRHIHCAAGWEAAVSSCCPSKAAVQAAVDRLNTALGEAGVRMFR